MKRPIKRRKITQAAILSCLVVLSAGCTELYNHRAFPESPSSSGMDDPVESDSIVRLRQHAPADSVVVPRREAMILFSMRDIEEYFREQPNDPDFDRLHQRIRDSVERQGWTLIEADALVEIVVAGLLEDGRAAIRDNLSGAFLPTVRMVIEQQSMTSGAADYKSFYTPDGRLLLRVIDSITVS